MPDSNQKDSSPPLFSWLSFSRSTYERQVQMNPVSAMLQNQAMATVRKLVTGAGMIAVVLAVVGGAVYKLQQGPDLRASFNMMQSLSGTVVNVDMSRNSFSLLYGSSFDSRVSALRKPKWTVLLTPGYSFSDTQIEKSICYVVDDLSGNLSNPEKAPCKTVVKAGKKVFIEYLFLTPSRDQLVAKSIIGQK